jgi:paraquat-inducible protein B
MTRANPKIVGAFILGGTLLLLVAVAALVSGKFFTRMTTFVVFFPESVRGLQIGSPVTFRGVPLGQVTGIEAFMTGKKDVGIDIEVTFQVDLDRIHDPAGVVKQLRAMGPHEAAKYLAEEGLRAELQNTSLVTGQLYIDLDFHPEMAPRFVDMHTRYPQLPTAPTKLQLLGDKVEKLATALANVPVEQIAVNVSEALVAVRDLARAKEIRTALVAAGTAGENLSRTLAGVDRLVLDVRGKVDAADVKKIVEDLHETLAATQRGLNQIQLTLQGTSGAQRELSHALSEIARAASAVRTLAEFLERNPSALVEGKKLPTP